MIRLSGVATCSLLILLWVRAYRDGIISETTVEQVMNAFKTRNRVHLASRNGKDFSQRFAELVRPLEPLPDETVIDGEIVALDGSGHPSFNLLQNYATREYSLVFYVFDLLILAGEDLRNEPLELRRKLLHTRVI